jgi:hypothetical protein
VGRLAVVYEHFQLELFIVALENLGGDVHPADDYFFARDDVCPGNGALLE